MKLQLSRFKFRFTIVVLCVVLLTAVTIESMTSRISGIVFEANSNIRVKNFIIMAAVCISMEVALVVLLRRKMETVGLIPLLQSKHVFMIALAVQILMFSLVLVIILEMQYLTKYQLILIKICLVASSSVSCAFILLLLIRLTQWYRTHHTWVILAYVLTTGAIILNIVSGMIYLIDELGNDPNLIRPMPFPIALVQHVEKGNGSLSTLYLVSYTIVFICTWVATVTLLHSYSQKLGRIRYWAIALLPLLYFLFQYEPFVTNSLAIYRLQDPIIYNSVYVIVTNASNPIGGVIFGTGFILISRRIESKAVQEYLLLCAMGFMLLFASNNFDILTTPDYPPYGILSLSALPISSFLIFIGIYSVAISISKDTSLRRNIASYIQGNAQFLRSLGNSEMEQSIKGKVFKITKRMSNQLPEFTQIESSLDEADIQKYINEIYELRKVSGARKSTSDND